MLFGGLSYFITCYIWPSYYGGVERTNAFLTEGMICFALGYIIFLKNDYKMINVNTNVYRYNYLVLLLSFMILGLFGTIYSLYKIGYIPTFSGRELSYERYSSAMGEISKLWRLNVIVMVISFYGLIIKKKYKKLSALIFIGSALQLSFFVVRFDLFIGLISCFVLYISTKKFERRMLVKLIIIGSLFLFFNIFFVGLRTGSLNPVQSSRHLNFFQRRIAYGTFSEYTSLVELMKSNYGNLNGRTLLNVPVAFLPKEVWEVFDVDKDEIQEQNAALILANIKGARMGLRTGIMGELYINFGFYGAFFMVFLGIIFAKIDNLVRALNKEDIRFLFLPLFIAILLYTINGQIDSIASFISFYLYIMLILMLFSKKTHYSNIQ
jgi:hypothetical protein